MQLHESHDAAVPVVAKSDAAFDGCYGGRKVLITGGFGFLGSNLAIRLVR